MTYISRNVEFVLGLEFSRSGENVCLSVELCYPLMVDNQKENEQFLFLKHKLLSALTNFEENVASLETGSSQKRDHPCITDLVLPITRIWS